MIDLKFDLSEFEKKARSLGAARDQIPFALSQAMNGAVKNAKEVIVRDTWPQHVTQRSPNFIGWVLRMAFSTKRNLQVEIYDRTSDQRAHLKLHADGGTKTARGHLAIPPQGSVTRGPRGVRKSQTPKAIIANTPKRALRITPRGIFVATSGRLVLKYIFRKSVEQPADVPFDEAFRDAMLRAVRASFPAAMTRAMRGRR